MSEQLSLTLPAMVPSGTTVINGCCLLRTEGEHSTVFVTGLAVHHYSAEDVVAAAYATVLLVALPPFV